MEEIATTFMLTLFPVSPYPWRKRIFKTLSPCGRGQGEGEFSSSAARVILAYMGDGGGSCLERNSMPVTMIDGKMVRDFRYRPDPGLFPTQMQDCMCFVASISYGAVNRATSRVIGCTGVVTSKSWLTDWCAARYAQKQEKSVFVNDLVTVLLASNQPSYMAKDSSYALRAGFLAHRKRG